MTPEREAKLQKVTDARQAGFIVVLEDIHDPHNAEAILRTCDAFGVHDVWFIFDKEKKFNPKRVGKSSSSSANKWLSFRTFGKGSEAATELHREDYTIVATALGSGAEDPYAIDLALQKVALAVGNEHRGLSEGLLKAADMVLMIPMRGMVESLNVSVATALLIAEITRQRIAKGLHLSRSDEEKARILSYFSDR